MMPTLACQSLSDSTETVPPRLRKRVRVVAAVAVVAILGGSAALTLGGDGLRRLAIRVCGAAYSVYDPLTAPSGTVYGPAGESAGGWSDSADRLAESLRQALPGVRPEVSSAPSSPTPAPFWHENVTAPPFLAFRDELDHLDEARDPFELSCRVRALTEHGEPDPALDAADPTAILKAAREGRELNCAPFSRLFVTACTAEGLTARVLGLSADCRVMGHAVAEVFDPALEAWVLIDPDFNIAYRRGGRWLNTAELHEAWNEFARLRPGAPADRDAVLEAVGVEVVALGPQGNALRQRNLHNFRESLLQYYRQIYYRLRNDYLSATYPPAHPVRVGQWVLSRLDDPLVFPEAHRVDAELVLRPPAAVWLSWRRADDGTFEFRATTHTPNFDHFAWTVDAEPPVAPVKGDRFRWRPAPGRLNLRVKAVNVAGVAAAETSLAISIEPPASPASGETGASHIMSASAAEE